MKEFIFNDKLQSVGNDAFQYCIGLTELSLPESLTTIGNEAFRSCKNLIKVNIPDNVRELSDYTFYECESLMDIKLGNSLESIGKSAFGGCKALDEIVISESVENIYMNAFTSCSSLREITLGSNIKTIGAQTFNYCNKLEKVNISDVGAWCGIEFAGTLSNPVNFAHGLCLNGENVAALEIPDGVNKIGNYAFVGATDFTSVQLPATLTSIGSYSFNGCTGLTSVTIPEAVEEIDAQAFGGCTGINAVVAKPATPPTAMSTSFDGLYDTATLYVSEGSLADYSNAAVWKKFLNVSTNEYSGVNGVEVDGNEAVEVYNLNGMKVGESTAGLAKGLYIVKQGAETRKIIVK